MSCICGGIAEPGINADQRSIAEKMVITQDELLA